MAFRPFSGCPGVGALRVPIWRKRPRGTAGDTPDWRTTADPLLHYRLARLLDHAPRLGKSLTDLERRLNRYLDLVSIVGGTPHYRVNHRDDEFICARPPTTRFGVNLTRNRDFHFSCAAGNVIYAAVSTVFIALQGKHRWADRPFLYRGHHARPLALFHPGSP